MSEQSVVLITGASSGFGFIASQKLADAGYRVYSAIRDINGRNKNASDQLSAYNSSITPIEVDLTSTHDIEACVAKIIATEGKIDVLVNNAGLMPVGITEAYSEEQDRAQMEVNYFAPAKLFRSVLPHMRKANKGLVVSVTSLAGRFVFPAFSNYCASKFALEALAEGYRYELAPFGVDSVILEPGPFKTQLINNSPKPAHEDVIASYGEHGKRLNSVLDGFADFYEQEGEGLANPNILVADLLNLIKTPYGERPVRTVSGVDYGLRDMNAAAVPFQEEILNAMGMNDLNPLKK